MQTIKCVVVGDGAVGKVQSSLFSSSPPSFLPCFLPSFVVLLNLRTNPCFSRRKQKNKNKKPASNQISPLSGRSIRPVYSSRSSTSSLVLPDTCRPSSDDSHLLCFITRALTSAPCSSRYSRPPWPNHFDSLLFVMCLQIYNQQIPLRIRSNGI